MLKMEQIYKDANNKPVTYIKGYYEELGRLHAQAAYKRELEFKAIVKQQREQDDRARKIQENLESGRYVCGIGNVIVDIITGEYV